MSDFTSVFSQERDHWRSRAEAAEAELERERARAREHLDARCRVEGRSEAWQMNADGWRQRATRAEAEVERLRGALDQAQELSEKWRYKGEFGWGPWQAGEGPDHEGLVLDQASRELRDVLRGDQ